MEVHAHSQTERKKWTHYLWEFLMLFLAVFCGFLAENLREHNIETNRAKELAESLYKEIYSDSLSIRNRIESRLKIKERKIDHFIDYIKDSSLTNPSDSFYHHFFDGFVNNYWFEPKDGILSQLRNSGSLRYFKSSQLQEEIGQLSVAIANVRKRNETEWDLLQSTVKPFLLKHYNFYGAEANYFQKAGILTKEEKLFEEKREPVKPEILNLDQLNKREAINMASYYLLIIRGTRRFQYTTYAGINHQLLEILRKDYHL